MAALSLGEPDRALLHAREACEQGLASRSPVAARILVAEGKPTQARSWYEQAVAAMPANESPCMFHRPGKFVEQLRKTLLPATLSRSAGIQPVWIHIHCFGELRIEIGDTTVYDRKWRGGRTKTLLKALIVHGGSKVSASRIADLLWPDSGGDQARQNLKVALWRLRHLGVDEKETPVSWLQVQHGHISLVRSLCEVDTLQFEHMLNVALAPAGTDVELLKDALERYRGDFLDSDVSENWIIEYRERLRRHFLRGVLELAALASDRDAIKQSVVFLHRALDVAPGDEQIYTQLMRAYLALGMLLGTSSGMAAQFVVNTTADTNDSTPGDGICADAGEVTLETLTIRNGSVNGSGGGISAGNSLLTLRNVVITDNVAVVDWSSQPGSLTLENTTITGNTGGTGCRSRQSHRCFQRPLGTQVDITHHVVRLAALHG